MKRVRGVFVGSGFNSSRTLGVAGWHSAVILFCFGSAASTVKCCNLCQQVKLSVFIVLFNFFQEIWIIVPVKLNQNPLSFLEVLNINVWALLSVWSVWKWTVVDWPLIVMFLLPCEEKSSRYINISSFTFVADIFSNFSNNARLHKMQCQPLTCIMVPQLRSSCLYFSFTADWTRSQSAHVVLSFISSVKSRNEMCRCLAPVVSMSHSQSSPVA